MIFDDVHNLNPCVVVTLKCFVYVMCIAQQHMTNLVQQHTI